MDYFSIKMYVSNKVLYIWDGMKVSKLWETFRLQVEYRFKEIFCPFSSVPGASMPDCFLSCCLIATIFIYYLHI